MECVGTCYFAYTKPSQIEERGKAANGWIFLFILFLSTRDLCTI